MTSNNEIEESYLGFIITDDVAAANPGMVAGTYALKGGDGGNSYASNVAILKEAFGYNSNTSRCTESISQFSQFTCNTPNFSVVTTSNGNVGAYDNGYYCSCYVVTSYYGYSYCREDD